MMFLEGLTRVYMCGKHCFEMPRAAELFVVRTPERKVRRSSLDMTKVVLCTAENVGLEQVMNVLLLVIGYLLKGHVFAKLLPWILVNVLTIPTEDLYTVVPIAALGLLSFVCKHNHPIKGAVTLQ
jgi:hypothetical protein